MNIGLESDLSNPHFAGAVNPDSVLSVRFFDQAMPNEFKSTEEGRPVKEMRTMVRIEVPGNTLSIVETFAYAHHQQRFPLQWAHYLNTKDGSRAIEGTALSDWPILTAAMVDEMKYFKFYTVEQIAGASDQQIGQLGIISGLSPYALRDKAKLYLQAAKDNNFVSKQDDMIRKQAAALEQMQAQLDALTKGASMAAQTATEANAERPKRGRKPKAKEIEARIWPEPEPNAPADPNQPPAHSYI